MLVPIVCFTCGCALGDKDDLFRHMRGERVAALLRERGTTPTQAAVDPDLQVDCGDILDLLDVRNDCCRTHLVTAMIFSDYY
jgi:DNA-directed RNA polymerase subunit N (RpoN/RPB10)